MNHQGYKENPEAMVAQAIIESRYGESGLAKYNNFFGMKAKEGTPPSQYVVMGTWEYGPNGRYWVPDAHFLRFDSPEAGLLGYDNFIKARYWFADALNYTNDPSGYIHAFMNTDHGQMAWATSPTYYDTLMNCIHSLKLSEIVAAGR